MLPYRFKAGGDGKMAAAVAPVHNHRSTTKNDHKPFKSRHASKSALKDAAKGKIEHDDRGKRRTPHQQTMSKLARKNHAKQLRINHKARKEQDTDIFRGVEGAAKHVAVVPLSPQIDVRRAINDILDGVDIEPNLQVQGTVRVRVDRYSRNVLFLPASFDMLNAMDVCKLADLVLFVLAADQDLDESTQNLIKAVEGQGITTVSFAVQDAKTKVPDQKHLSKRLAEVKLQLDYFFPDLDKLSVLDHKTECALLMRKICTITTKGIRWRDARSWMLVEDVQWPSLAADSSNVTLTGTVRGKNLNPDRLVHVPGWGDYQIARITQIPTKAHKRKADDMTMDEEAKHVNPSPDQDDLAELAPEEANMTDVASVAVSSHKGVLLDDHHYFEDDTSHIPEKPSKLPHGTSDYQSAWYLEDVSDSDDDDMMDDDLSTEEQSAELEQQRPEDGFVLSREDAMTDVPGTEYPESEMHVDADAEEEKNQLQEYRASRRKEAEDDLEFPDEIELHPDQSAKERLAKYRGLKNLRTSEWNAAEDAAHEPQDHKRLLQVADYKKSYNSAIKESLGGGIPAGSPVQVELRGVPISRQALPPPSALFSLLRHEHKHAVVNLNITLNSDLEDPVKSKEELVVQIGHRRLAINPIFSAGGVTPNDVHKFDRFLHPGHTAVATFTGPLTWGSVPVLVFKQTKPDFIETTNNNVAPRLLTSDELATSHLKLIGTATTIPPSSSRIIAKRVILTGHPFKIHKKLVTIRYMFFNREDVEWFKALPLWTKRGRQGWIKEGVGTHGYFKAIFDAGSKLSGMDVVGVSLYKRVWPRSSTPLN